MRKSSRETINGVKMKRRVWRRQKAASNGAWRRAARSNGGVAAAAARASGGVAKAQRKQRGAGEISLAAQQQHIKWRKR